MIELVWEIVVKAEAQRQFELVYGPGGAWSKLFSKAPGFRGTTMLNDIQNPHRYLIVDVWDSAAQHEQALRDNAGDYARLEANLTAWVDSRTEVGVFRVRSEGAVRPMGSAGRRGRRTPR